jgi:hypothetical protein
MDRAQRSSKMTRRIRTGMIGFAVLAVLLAAPVASWAGSYGGVGRLQSVDTAERTVTIGGLEMRVGSSVSLLDRDGRRLDLAALAGKRQQLVHYYGTKVGGTVLVDQIKVSSEQTPQGDH